jgi:hypothetical protein
MKTNEQSARTYNFQAYRWFKTLFSKLPAGSGSIRQACLQEQSDEVELFKRIISAHRK